LRNLSNGVEGGTGFLSRKEGSAVVLRRKKNPDGPRVPFLGTAKGRRNGKKAKGSRKLPLTHSNPRPLEV